MTQVVKQPIETWLVDFFDGEGVLIETKEVKRAKSPTRWAKNYVLTLRRKMQGAPVTYTIGRIS